LQGKYTLVGDDPTTSLFRTVEEANAAGYEVRTMDHGVLGELAYFSFDPLAFNSWVQHAQQDPTATDAQQSLSNSTLTLQPNWSEINEETTAFYVEATKSYDLSGRDLTVVAGVRYEDTKIDSTSLERTLISLTPPAVEGENYIREFAENVPFTDKGNYDVFLPNLSIKYDLLEDVIVRFAASRTITRPELTDMRSSRDFGDIREGQSGIGSAGNPNLEPFMSDNFDLSAEWYINDFDYVSIGAFSKSIDNFVVTEAAPEVITGVTDPATGQDVVYEIRRPRNLDTKEVSGIEIGGQHFFGESGFGMIANATFVFADPEYDYDTPLGEVPTADAVVGVSDSANLIGFYENGPFQIRIAYNWRDSFIRGFQYYYSSTSNEPVVVEDYSQVDISMSYELTENVSVFLEGINVTEEGSRIHGRKSNQMFYNGEGVGRYALGVRASF
ncbi:MAG TPA: TonB-dependent receptor, partial [Cellvibrio sp.]|nr:TonB-dependent receptor [Cellvibrio sp.]